MSREDCDWIIGFGMMVAGLVGLGYGIGVHCKMKKLCEKLDMTIENISNDVPIDIPKEVINQAVEMAAERAAQRAVNDAASTVIKQLNIDIHNQVAAAVSNERDKIAKEVTDTIADRVAKIDENSLRREVVEKAKEQISDKFDSKLDNLLDDFNSNLNNVSKIYSSIAQSMVGNKEMIFKVG